MTLELKHALELAYRNGKQADVSQGMAMLFEDRPLSPCMAVVTTVFAEKFCQEFAGYAWRKL